MAGAVDLLVILAAGILFMTPLGFGKLPSAGEYRVKIRVNAAR